MSIFKRCQHKYGTVDNKGYQYCIICGKAEFVGVPTCNHIWKTINTLVSKDIYTHAVVKHIYVQQCTKCGKLQKFTT